MNASQKDSTRLFYALWPDDATRTALMQVQTGMHGRLVPYENLHITLAFLGQQPNTLLPALRDILMHLPKMELSLTIDRVGYFARNKIAWAGMRNVPAALNDLQSHLIRALDEQRVVFNSHGSFKPHITLARDATLAPDIVFTPISWQAKEAALVQSITGPGGSTYRVLASRSLHEDVWKPGQL